MQQEEYAVDLMVDNDLSAEYVNWTRDTLGQIRSALSTAATDSISGDLSMEIYGHAHNLKGMGSSFDYQLMTEIGSRLCLLLKDAEGPKTISTSLLETFMAAMEKVIDNGMTGDGGPDGANLLKKLDQTVSN